MHFTDVYDKPGSQYQLQCHPLARARAARKTSPGTESDAQPEDTLDAHNPTTIDAEPADVPTASPHPPPSALPSIDEFYPGFTWTTPTASARTNTATSVERHADALPPLPLPPIEEFYPGFRRAASDWDWTVDADGGQRLPPIRALIDSLGAYTHTRPPAAALTDDAFCARAYPGGYAHPYPPSHAHPYAHAKTRRDAMAAAVEPPADPFYVNSAWWVLRPYAVPVVNARHAHAPQPPPPRRRIAALPRRSAQRGVYDSPNAYKGKQREEETREVWRFGTHQSRREGEEAYPFGFRAAYAYPPSAIEAKRGGG